jgi:hypothetical protein
MAPIKALNAVISAKANTEPDQTYISFVQSEHEEKREKNRTVIRTRAHTHTHTERDNTTTN